jgi:acetyl-CoA carboxylase carboxyl transferase subunit alpha
MLENAIYAVASPEASASILWKDAARAQDAANNMKITAQDLLGFGVIDGIIAEPPGGAHRHPETVMASTADAIATFLRDFPGSRGRLEIREQRREKFMSIGSGLN